MSDQAKHRIKRIRISNVLGIDELEIEPGSVTIVEGANATGKTSFVAALKAALVGGHDATLIRNGTDAGEVVIVLDDDTQLRRRITRNGAYLDIDGVERSPQTWLNTMTDALALNPIRFLDAKPKDQARMLLEAMPVTVSGEELREAVGGQWNDGPVEGHALEVIERVRTGLYDDRTGVNRLAREHTGTVKQLEQAVPAANADVDGLSSVIAEELDERQQDADRLEQERRERQDTLGAKHQAAVEKLRDDSNKRIVDLRHQIRDLENQLRDAEHEYQQTVAQYGTALAERKAVIDKDVDGKAAAIRERMTELRGQAARVEEAQRTREALDVQREKLAARKAESGQMTAALERLDGLKDALLERLPIRGLTVRDGELYRGDIPFGRLNKAEQVKAALRLAQIRAGDIPIVCADGMEALDPDTFDAFVTEASEQDVHLFVTRVTTDPALTVRTEGEKVQA